MKSQPNNKQLQKVAESFYSNGSVSSERHSVSSLGRRLLLSRQTIRKMIASGELKPETHFAAGQGRTLTFEFSGPMLDAQRREVVHEIIREIVARLRGLDVDEQQLTLAALHSLRAQKNDCETQFSQPDDDDDDELGKILGGAAGGTAGAAIGGKIGGTPGTIAGALIGGGLGSVAGNKVGQSRRAKSTLVDAAEAGALGYGAHRLIQNAGGYRSVATKAGDALTSAVGPDIAGAGATVARVARGRMVDALRRAVASL